MTQRILYLIPWVILASIVIIPFLCFFQYKNRKVRTSLVFSHLWCVIASFFFGIILLHTLRRNLVERPEYAGGARRLIQIARNLREGETQESIKNLDAFMAGTLYRSASNISDEKMGELDPEILWVWQDFKEYYETYNVEETAWGMVPHVRRKLAHVPWSDMQLAIKKFERIYGSGEIAIAPKINMKSWISQAIPNEELKNKVILLDFWNIHCGPCIKSFPELQKLHDKYEKQGLVVITCAGGNKKETKKFLVKHKYSFPAGMAASQMYLDYAVRGNPSYFLIDRNGYLVWGPEHRLPTDAELASLLLIK